MKNVKFAFTERTQHHHPHLETEIEYAGVAQINGEEVSIKCLTATQQLLVKGARETDFGGVSEPQCAVLEIPANAEDQHWVKGSMGVLLGKCRFHAQQEYYRQEQAENAIREENELAPERPDFRKPVMREDLSEVE